MVYDLMATTTVNDEVSLDALISDLVDHEQVYCLANKTLYIKDGVDIVPITSHPYTFDTIGDMELAKHLRVNDVVDLNGYYTVGDGAGHKRILALADDGSGVPVGNLFANLIHDGIVYPEWFGAKGDGTTNDTIAIKNTMAYGANVQLKEKIYMTNETVIVNVEKQWLRGLSTRSVLKAIDATFVGEEVVLFQSGSNHGGASSNWGTRVKRGNTHGFFMVSGDNTGTSSNKEDRVHGIRLGGKVGSIYEGHVEISEFRDIISYNCNIGLVYGAHVYKDIVANFYPRGCKYGVKSSDDQDDAGEVFTLLNCSLFDCTYPLDVKMGIDLIGCTIHPNGGIKVTGSYAKFTNCHFEILNGTSYNWSLVDEAMFNVGAAVVTFTNCDGIIGNSLTVPSDKLIFKTAQSGSNGRIELNGGAWKYFFSRLRFTAPVCIGQVELKFNSPFHFDSSMTSGTKFYTETNTKFLPTPFAPNGMVILAGGDNKSQAYTHTDNGDGSVNYAITLDGTTGSDFHILKKISIDGHRSMKVDIDVEKVSANITKFQFKLGGFCLIFLDQNGDVVDGSYGNHTGGIFYDGGEHMIYNKAIGIPTQASYVLYGISGLTNSGSSTAVEVKVNKCYIELF